MHTFSFYFRIQQHTSIFLLLTTLWIYRLVPLHTLVHSKFSWVVTLCRLVDGCRWLIIIRCLHPQGEVGVDSTVNYQAACTSESSLSASKLRAVPNQHPNETWSAPTQEFEAFSKMPDEQETETERYYSSRVFNEYGIALEHFNL
jgi:hypothetical protein